MTPHLTDALIAQKLEIAVQALHAIHEICLLDPQGRPHQMAYYARAFHLESIALAEKALAELGELTPEVIIRRNPALAPLINNPYFTNQKAT